MDQLYTENISKSYGDFWAIKNINIRVPRQSIFGLLGPNGAGKTTLIRIITQIIFADHGEIYFSGERIKEEHISRIGYLPEERGLYKKMKVGEQLIYLARLKGMSAGEASDKIKQWLQKYEIYDWWNKKIEDLSKGMQQKIQFISTVLHEPEMIILDEPFSGFDPINVNLIKDEILELRKKGSTIILSTHRMESVEELCDNIALINKSKVILEGSKNEIKEKYKTNTYLVEHIHDLEALNGSFEIIDKQPMDNNRFYTKIRITDNTSPNELLKSLMDKIEIHSFIEKIPSMNDIFIRQVNSRENE